MVSIWSSDVELPIQPMFIGLCAQICLCMYGGDTCDAYAYAHAHTPALEVMTHLIIAIAYFEWLRRRPECL